MKQRARALACFLTAAALSGCGGDPPNVSGIAGAALSSESASGGSAFPDASADASKSETAFSPFGEPQTKAPGGREIIENPTSADVMQPGPLPEMALGRADAPVTLVQYASLTCPHCRNFHEKVFPEFKRTYVDTGKVRYILREFPIGKQSGNATIALRCAKPEKYFDLYGKFMSQQASWVSQEVRLDPIFAVAQQAGLKRAEFDACLANAAMIDGLKAIKERGRKLGIIGTPNYFLNGKLIKKELTMADLRAMIDPLLTGAVAQR